MSDSEHATVTPTTAAMRLPPADYLTLAVVDIERALPGQVRLSLQAPELAGFGPYRPGAWVRVFIPGPQGDVGRAYSIRHYDREACRLQIQVMRRRHPGQRSQCLLETIRPGDRLHVIGPRGGAEPRQDVDWHLMLGDETALAAISSRLARLPATLPVEAWAEVPLPAAAYQEDPRIQWLTRGPDELGPSRLWQVLRQLPARQGRGEVWIAGESALVRALEQWCRQHGSHCELDIKAMGYWQLPAAARP